MTRPLQSTPAQRQFHLWTDPACQGASSDRLPEVSLSSEDFDRADLERSRGLFCLLSGLLRGSEDRGLTSVQLRDRRRTEQRKLRERQAPARVRFALGETNYKHRTTIPTCVPFTPIIC